VSGTVNGTVSGTASGLHPAPVLTLVQAAAGSRAAAARAGAAGELRADQLCWWRDDRPVLDRLSLALRPGELLAVCGGDWSGQRALLHLLAGWHDPHGGRVLLDGQPVAGWPRRRLAAAVALVDAHAVPVPGCTVADLLATAWRGQAAAAPERPPWPPWPQRPQRPQRLPRPPGLQQPPAAVAGALYQLGLQPWAQQRCSQLSPALLLRARIAQALAQGARYVLLDEPQLGLDAAARAQLLRDLRRLAAAGLGILFTTRPGACCQPPRPSSTC